MSIFLQWASYSVRSKERVLSNLFSYLSPRWYPNKIIGSDIYNILEMYADQLSTSSVEIHQVYDDLSLNTVRTSPISGRTTSKMYDNFGSIYLANKLIIQDNELYNSSNRTAGYRQNLRFLADAYLIGSTIQALYQAGQGYTGVAPIVLQPFVDHLGWQLTSFSASVVAAGKNVVVLDRGYPGIGNIIYTNDLTSPLGKTIYYSRSRLGYNTRPVSKQHFYSGLKVFMFGSSSVNSYPFITPGSTNASLQTSFENVVKNLVRADIDPIFFYSNNYVYDRYAYGDTLLGDSEFYIHTNGYVTNNISQRSFNAPTGSLLRSRVVALPADYVNYDWFYDWSVLARNDTYYNVAVRSYPTSVIPDTVYFKDVKNFSPGTLMLQIPSGSNGAHWVFSSVNEASDIQGNSNSLVPQPSTVGNIDIMRPRQGLSVGIYGARGSYVYENVTGETLNFYNEDFFCEAWITGIDNTTIGTFSYFSIKRQSTEDFSNILTSAGYSISIEGSSKKLQLSIRDASDNIYTIEGDISTLFDEEPERPHYFAASYNQGLCFLFLDGKEIAKGTCTVTPPNVSSGYTYIHAEGTDIGVDEIVLTSGQLLPTTALERFNYSKPYQLNQAINRLDLDQYHQLQIAAHTYGSNEFEYHQFSVRGIYKEYMPDLSLAYITGQALELQFTGKPAIYTTDYTNMNLYDFTGKAFIYVKGQSSINNLRTGVSYEVFLDKSATIELTGKVTLKVKGQSSIDNFRTGVTLAVVGSQITTEDGTQIITEDGTTISIE